MPIKIALAGNPNCGKTTLFNDLTGSSQYVGNWPGVTVEKKEGKLRGHRDVTVTDLPGIYSLSPYTLEEVVTRDYLLNDSPDVIINLVDASNIERNLYLTTQLLELGIPVVVALNMMDIVKKNGDTINIQKLSKQLGCPIIETTAVKGIGSKELVGAALDAAGTNEIVQATFRKELELTLDTIATLFSGPDWENHARWYAIKLFERDEKVLASLNLDETKITALHTIIEDYEETEDDDSESIITSERYAYISDVVSATVRKKNTGMTTSDKIDRIVTNRWLALPIFAAVMFFVYFVSISTFGTGMTDWVNDKLFDEGWHLFGIGASDYENAADSFERNQQIIDAYLEAAEEAGIHADAARDALAYDEGDYDSETEAESMQNAAEDALSRFLTDANLVGLETEAVILDENENELETLAVSLAVFEEAAAAAEPDPADFGIFVPSIPALAEMGLEKLDAADWLNGLVVDGIIGGVGAVLGFVPQMLVLFFFLSILEDCGYMARVAFIMDRIFRKFGLSGKSFIPMLVSSGCGVPGIMASRTIENDKDRKMTIMVTTFIPCGAKLPIIALIGGALFQGGWWVAPSMYFLGIAVVILSGIILKKTRLFAGEPAPFVMELPQYHLPGLKGVLIHMWERGRAFIIKAGTIIFVACGLIWFLSSFSWNMQMVDQDSSILADIGRVIAPIFAPLGFGNWQSAVATVSGLVAKENVVGTMGVFMGLAEDVAETDPSLMAGIGSMFTTVSALSFLVFNLLCAPCFAAIGAIRREMGGWKWTMIAVGYQTLLAYIAAFIVYQIGVFAVLGSGFGVGTAIAILMILAILFLLVRRDRYNRLPGGTPGSKAPAVN